MVTKQQVKKAIHLQQMCLKPFQVFHLIMRKIASTEDVKYVVRHRSLKKVKLEACGSIPHPQAPVMAKCPGFAGEC